MSRSGYSDGDCDNWATIRWRGAVKQAIRGKRGQAFLREMLAAMDAMPVKELITENLEKSGNVCAIGSVGKARGMDMSNLDPYDQRWVADAFGIPYALAAEIVFENDEGTIWQSESPSLRFDRMRRWIVSNIKEQATT